MKTAVIDIGSNAIRFQLARIFEYNNEVRFKNLEYVRYPLGLGKDVFKIGSISNHNIKRLYTLIEVFKNLMNLYEPHAYHGCATSAMRESTNGADILGKIYKKYGLKIEIISGDKEAELINLVIINTVNGPHTIHVDVGGGSTEINIYDHKRKIASSSFRIGSLREMNPKIMQQMIDWIAQKTKNCDNISCIGTGGNINKLLDLAGILEKPKCLTLNKILELYNFLNALSYKELTDNLQLNPDRADVIVPATKIYISVMKVAKCKEIVVPNIGLKEGIAHFLFQTNYSKVVKGQRGFQK